MGFIIVVRLREYVDVFGDGFWVWELVEGVIFFWGVVGRGDEVDEVEEVS